MKYNIPTEPYINLQNAVIDAAFFPLLQNLKNQIMTTNVWVEQVIMDFFLGPFHSI